jgi:dihydrofolate reductase
MDFYQIQYTPSVCDKRPANFILRQKPGKLNRLAASNWLSIHRGLWYGKRPDTIHINTTQPVGYIRMHVSLMVAITVDGKIARSSDHFPDWTGKADKKFYVEVTKKAGVMIMGSTTFDTIGRALPGRKTVVMTRNPERRSEREDLVFTPAPPAAILADLAGQGYDQAVVVGGATINQLFACEGLIDELILTISPFAFGSGLSIFSDTVDLKLALDEVRQLDENTLCVRYRVIRPDQSPDAG